MRALLTVLACATVVVVGASCAGSSARGPAWDRWGLTRPTTGRDAEAKLAGAYRLLYDMKFDSALTAYRELARELPGSAEAHLGLSMALRYCGRRDSALAEAQAALALDSAAAGVLIEYADLLLPIRTGDLPGRAATDRYAEAERCLLRAAASDHPFAVHAHTNLWAGYMAQGRLADARTQAAALAEREYYPQPLLDFARNLLAGLAPDAVIFTNGDNDTYPLWALQNGPERFRPDVTVANLSLLNIPAVVRMMRDSLALPVSLGDDEIAALAPRPLPGGGTLLVSQRVVGDVVANATARKRPVYFAVTVSEEYLRPYQGRLVSEGLVHRVTDKVPPGAMDQDRVRQNLKELYRLDWPDTLPPWPQNMSPITRNYAPLGLNYAALYARLAGEAARAGRRDDADSALTLAVTWMKRGGRQDAAYSLLDDWLRSEPGDTVAQRLKTGLAGRPD